MADNLLSFVFPVSARGHEREAMTQRSALLLIGLASSGLWILLARAALAH